ncbi:alkaline ceramidase ydc1 [Dispira parvispora]|uniref:Alkaline ceramidase ydc1 n=1 Tax=Dispira parvispora TaxID=1520584 RepID=A0A9W8AS22_9FUNG|nr:alkaline ceramidase ydc1 [Dispira parvispora]
MVPERRPWTGVNPYIAELWNTVTNLNYYAPIGSKTLNWSNPRMRLLMRLLRETELALVVLAFFGLYFVKKHDMERRFSMCFLGMILVGLGSSLFHSTLRFEMQLMDELPMIYATCFCLYSVFQMRREAKHASELKVLLFLYCAFVTAVYLKSPNPVFHQVAYGLEMLAVAVRCYQLIQQILPGAYRDSLVSLIKYSTGTFLSGFILWNIDTLFCPHLQSSRRVVGSPWDVLLQFHGWWHVLTGLGCYGFVTLTMAMRLYFLDKHRKYKVCYFKGILPYLRHIIHDKRAM